MIPRYRTMKGYMVPRKAGWDTHGLPVELEVEKKLGLDGIYRYGRERKLFHPARWQFLQCRTDPWGGWKELDVYKRQDWYPMTVRIVV